MDETNSELSDNLSLREQHNDMPRNPLMSSEVVTLGDNNNKATQGGDAQSQYSPEELENAQAYAQQLTEFYSNYFSNYYNKKLQKQQQKMLRDVQKQYENYDKSAKKLEEAKNRDEKPNNGIEEEEEEEEEDIGDDKTKIEKSSDNENNEEGTDEEEKRMDEEKETLLQRTFVKLNEDFSNLTSPMLSYYKQLHSHYHNFYDKYYAAHYRAQCKIYTDYLTYHCTTLQYNNNNNNNQSGGYASLSNGATTESNTTEIPNAPLKQNTTDYYDYSSTPDSQYADYTSRANFNRMKGRFQVQTSEEHWSSNRLPTDREGRQMAAFFDFEDYQQKQRELKEKQREHPYKQPKHTAKYWKKVKEEKKRKRYLREMKEIDNI